MSLLTVLKATSSPVNYAFAVQEKEADCNLRRVESVEGRIGRLSGRRSILESACGREPACARVVSSSRKIGKGFFFFFQRRQADERRRNPADERRSNDEGKMEMSSGARIGFR